MRSIALSHLLAYYIYMYVQYRSQRRAARAELSPSLPKNLGFPYKIYIFFSRNSLGPPPPSRKKNPCYTTAYIYRYICLSYCMLVFTYIYIHWYSQIDIMSNNSRINKYKTRVHWNLFAQSNRIGFMCSNACGININANHKHDNNNNDKNGIRAAVAASSLTVMAQPTAN